MSTGCSTEQKADFKAASVSLPHKEGPHKSLWKIVLNSRQLGPLETYIQIKHQQDTIYAHSESGIIDLVGTWSSTAERPPQSIFSFQATRDPLNADRFVGTLKNPWEEKGLTLEFQGDSLSGTVNHWLLGGDFNGKVCQSDGPIRDYQPVLEAFDRVVEQRIFDPKTLKEEAFGKFRQRLQNIAKRAQNDFDMTLGFHFAWYNEPFSHFQLRRSLKTSQEMFESFDGMLVGYEAARVRFEDDLAILRVDTMMGQDTIEQIKTAYDEIGVRGSKRLIIDLRGNGGGAFAVKPLVEHIIDEPFESGYFLSRPWFTDHINLPSEAILEQTAAWKGWSIGKFWQDVQRQGVMKLRFEPAEPHFAGPVFVLVDSHSASATELAADAFRISGRATLIGERTAGEMLSQSFFDLFDGYILSLPVADYYSMEYGRIEGTGVPVNIQCASEQALDYAKRLSSDF
jgi:hypothetical protein